MHFSHVLSNINRLTWIKVQGTKYKAGGVVVVQMELNPLLGLVHELIVFDVNDYYIVCEKLVTECFNPHYHSYEVTRSSPKSFAIYKPSDLVDHNVLGLYNRFSSLFVTLKYYLIEQK